MNKSKQYLLYILFLLLLIFFSILTSNFTFISDDWEILKTAQINPLPLLSDWKTNNFNMYRPLVVLSYYINFIISGYSAVSFYLFNFLIHLLTTILFFKIAHKILVAKYKLHKFVPVFASAVFFVLPQNIMNILWIAGRTDLLMTFFMMLSVNALQKYLIENKNIYLVVIVGAQLLSFMSKETAIIFPIYWVFLFVIYKRQINKRKIIYLAQIGVILLLGYTIFRLLIFGSDLLGHQKFIDLDLNGVVKYMVYGIWSLVIPFDILDIIYYLQNNILFLMLLGILIISLVYLVVVLFLRSPYKKIIGFGVLLTFLSLLIYIGNYPQMRLMYAHLPLLILSISILFYSGGLKIRLFIGVFLVITIISSASLIYRNSVIQYHTKSLLSAIPSTGNYENDSKILLLPALGRVGQTWARPWPNLMYKHKSEKEIHQQVSNFSNVIAYETYSITKYENLINYKMLSENILQISIREGSGILVPEASYKFNDSFTIPNGIVSIEPINYSSLRKHAAVTCNIALDTTMNLNIIFWDGKKYLLKTKGEFFKWMQRNEGFTFSR